MVCPCGQPAVAHVPSLEPSARCLTHTIQYWQAVLDANHQPRIGDRLTARDVVWLRQQAAAGVSRRDLAQTWGRSPRGIDHILARRRWKDVA